MNDKIKETFNQIQAEAELKSRTKKAVFQKTKGYTKSKTANYRHFLSAAACMILLLIGGRWIYFTPTVEVSIDINPSIELSVNRFDRVISVEGYNDSGRDFISSMDIKFMNYSKAVNQIIENDTISALLAKDGIMTIVVVGSDKKQTSEVFHGIQSCTDGKGNTYCYRAHASEVEKAHEMGLSYGKYKAFLEVQTLDPDITADEIQNMTMREIRELIETLSGESETNGFGNGKGCGNSYGNGCGNGGNGERNGRGRKNGREELSH